MKKKLTLKLEAVRNLDDSDVNTVGGGFGLSLSTIPSTSDPSIGSTSLSLPPPNPSVTTLGPPPGFPTFHCPPAPTTIHSIIAGPSLTVSKVSFDSTY